MNINEILLIGLFSAWFAGESGIPTYIKNTLFKFGIKKEAAGTIGQYVPIRLKPFDCEKCLAFWIGVVVFPWALTGIAYACLASLTAITAKLILDKLKP